MKVIPFALSAIALVASGGARADVITDWNVQTHKVIAEAKIGTPPAVRVTALVQTSVLAAVESVPKNASIEAAVAAANRVALTKLLPAQQATIDAAATRRWRTCCRGSRSCSPRPTWWPPSMPSSPP